MRTDSERGPAMEQHDRVGRSSTSSEVVILDDRITAAADNVPNVANLNISKSSRVHIGPKFVSVTQNVNNTELVRGRLLGLELESTKRARRLRCSVAVFVCWAFIVVFGLALYLLQVLLPNQDSRLDIGLMEHWYLRREDWQAMPPYGTELLQLPVKYVLIGHTASDYCDQKYACIEKVLAVQQNHLRRGFDDIGPNYLVGGNGYLFEGRGANFLGAMVKGWNRNSISIMFLGNYKIATTDEAQLENIKKLLEVLVKKSVLIPDYILYGHCQVATITVSPGPNILSKLNFFSHWNPANKSACLT